MKFYGYRGEFKLGTEPLGTSERVLFELKTIKGAVRRARSRFGHDDFSLYSYTDFYDNDTFKKIDHTKCR